MLAEIERVNRSSPSTPIVIGSADVKALYPNLDIDFTIEKVCETFANSTFSLEGVDYKQLGLYLALNLTKQELARERLAYVCPTRRHPKAKCLTMTGSSNRGKDSDRFGPWLRPRWQPTAREKRMMVVQGLGIALRKVMHNHVYVFDGVIRKQAKGGPIGLELTGNIAQVFMMWWDKEIKKRLEAIGLTPLMYQRYVDDINTVSPVPPPGFRYVNGSGHVDAACVARDLSREGDERLFTLWKTVADSIHPSIQVEVDFPSRHLEKSVPILDLRVWVEETIVGGKYVVMHEYYMKDVASKAVLNARSTVPYSMKRTVLTQEALRVL